MGCIESFPLPRAGNVSPVPAGAEHWWHSCAGALSVIRVDRDADCPVLWRCCGPALLSYIRVWPKPELDLEKSYANNNLLVLKK